MFPDITRDDVFRLETRRLWLRWPMRGDAAALTASAGDGLAVAPQAFHAGLTGEIDRTIEQWRAVNQAGLGLALVITGRDADRTPFGAVAIEAEAGAGLSVRLRPDRRGLGLATEAVQAIVDATFTLSATREVWAAVRVVNPAARRVFERCGFAYEATVLHGTAAQGGMAPCDRFRLDRKAWASLKSWRMPVMARDLVG